jgi:gluconokinase
MSKVLVIMGVSGSGKTTVGRALAAQLGIPFFDGDDFHPPENVAVMGEGVPLDDARRAPWLARLAALIKSRLDMGGPAVVACSALKKRYRDQLRISDDVRFIFLKGEYTLIQERMRARKGHYMTAEMLQSQLNDLEAPPATEAIIVPVDQPVEGILWAILQNLSDEPSSASIE